MYQKKDCEHDTNPRTFHALSWAKQWQAADFPQRQTYIASHGDHATEHVDAVIVATGRIIDVMILNGWTSECWYRYADDGVRWLLSEVTSIDPRNAILPPLSSHDFAFSSWCDPPPRKVIEFSETLGVIAEHLGKGPSVA